MLAAGAFLGIDGRLYATGSGTISNDVNSDGILAMFPLSMQYGRFNLPSEQ